MSFVRSIRPPCVAAAALMLVCCSHRALVVSDSTVDVAQPGDVARLDHPRPDTLAPRDMGQDWTRCPKGPNPVYVIDQDHKLYSFEPPKNTTSMAFTLLGKLSCPVKGNPYSMAIRRDGQAFVLYAELSTLTNHECTGLCQVDLETLQCQVVKTFACGAGGFSAFGMGYVATGLGSERLFIGSTDDTKPMLAMLDPGTGTVTPIGPLPSSGPEFAGNAGGELWGFYPRDSPATVHRHDWHTGKVLATITLSQFTQPWAGAYAFTMWGGQFYVFYGYGSSTNVYKLTKTGKLSLHLQHTNLTIVGAGVSTCAPAGPD